jgi:hypothetical protein
MLIVGSLLASSVARTSKGILVGVARDASGAVVVNATVTIVGNPRQILWLQLSCWFAVRATSAASHPLHYSTALWGASTHCQSCGGRFRGGRASRMAFRQPIGTSY